MFAPMVLHLKCSRKINAGITTSTTTELHNIGKKECG